MDSSEEIALISIFIFVAPSVLTTFGISFTFLPRLIHRVGIVPCSFTKIGADDKHKSAHEALVTVPSMSSITAR